MLSRVRRLSGILRGLGGTGGGRGGTFTESELLFEAEDDKLTKCVVSADDWGLKTRLP